MTKKIITKHSIGLGVIFALLIALSFGSTAFANDADSSNRVPVHMVVTVKARHGNQVPVVSANDVKVFQRDKQNMVTGWLPFQGDRAGLQLFILIDETSRDSVSLQFKSIEKFIDDQPASTSIGIGYMRNGMVATAQALTPDHDLAKKALRLPIGASVGYTSPYLALSDLMKKWPGTKDRREILMITSGIDPLGGGFSDDPYNNPYLNAAANQAQRGGFVVYSIYTSGAGVGGRGRGFRTAFQQAGLDLLSQKTGGETYYLGLGSPVDFTPYLDDVSYSLKHQYELVFLAKGAKKPTLEPVKVKTEMPNMGLITAEAGYVGTGS
ncbi:MAG: hypothetical protein WCD49_15485 [Candidatus Acidiferrales bacterium]